MQTAVLNVKDVLLDSQSAIDSAKKYLSDNGVEFKLDEWLTVKKYCEKFNIEDTQIVSNWIKRGRIPVKNIKVIEELNGLKLIKAIAYI
jgi:hypothetical protein